MLYHALKLLKKDDVSKMVGELMMSSEWIDGASSAVGVGVKSVKRNLQLSPRSDTYRKLKGQIDNLLMSDSSSIQSHIFPKKVINLLFSRTSVGMYYGKHVDNAYVSEGRRDYSFTLFLNDPSEYDGGELVLSIPPEKKAIKLTAGNLIVYPTKYLHEVKEVTKGERIVCVGWIESYIKNNEEREMLACIRSSIEHARNDDIKETVFTLNIAYQRLAKYFGC